MSLSTPFPPLTLRAEHELPLPGSTVQNPRREFWTVAQSTQKHGSTPHRPRPTMSQNPPEVSKIRLVSDRTPTERIVFYCVSRDTHGAKSANYGIKNRV